MQFSLIKDKIFNKNILFSMYFVFFISLNILDFIGKLSADLDFLKKILSWTLIIILFYQISLTKIFIGKKMHKYDLVYMLGFCILIIPKILKVFFMGINQNNFSEFIIFKPLVILLDSLITEGTFSLVGSAFLGIVILLLTNFVLLSNHRVKEASFIGSLGLKSNLGHKITTHLSLFFLVFFFAFVIAPFFLEWFALTVDSLILIIGLVYYLVIFINKYKNQGRLTNFLRLTSNSGNLFFKSLIHTFSNKKTFFIGISFLLAVHLVVDIGIYMVPYLIGTSSPLYFEAFDANIENEFLESRDHIPLFNIFDYSNSQSSSEISTIFNSDNTSNIFLKLIQFFFIVLLYGSSYMYFFILLGFPFYYIFKRIKNQIISLPKGIIIFIISMTLFFILSQDFFMPTISMPLLLGTTQSVGVEGIDIHTSSIFKDNVSLTSVDFSDTISLLIFFIMLFIVFILMKFEKYRKIFTYITYSIFLIFFMIYIILFYVDFNGSILQKITGDEQKDSFISERYDYSSYISYISKGDIINSPFLKIDLLQEDLNLSGRFYTHKDKITFFYGEYELFKDQEELQKNPRIYFHTSKNVLIALDYIPNFQNISLEQLLFDNYIDSKNSLISQENSKELQNSFLEFIRYLAFFFSTIFYVIGSIIFAIHYIKTLYRRELR